MCNGYSYWYFLFTQQLSPTYLHLISFAFTAATGIIIIGISHADLNEYECNIYSL